jgi:hypothetical protein
MLAVALDPDSAQISTLAEKKRPPEDVRGLRTVPIQSAHLLSAPPSARSLIFRERYDRKRKPSQRALPPGIGSLAVNLVLPKIPGCRPFFYRKIPFSKILSRINIAKI